MEVSGDMRIAKALQALALAALWPASSPALDFTLGDVSGTLRTQVGIGAMRRMEGQNPSLIGKTNLPGQEQFCEDKPAGSAPGRSCVDVAGNAAFLALPGYPSANTDNGDLNYRKGELTSAAMKVAPRLQLSWGDYGFDLTGLYFYDAINANFDETHPNNIDANNGLQPATTKRDAEGVKRVGTDARILDAYVSGTFPLMDEHPLSFKIGPQVLSLGTTTLLVLNGLNVVNAPDANIRFMPGSDTREVFQRVPMAAFGVPINEQLSIDSFYAYQWKGVIAPPAGSFFSTNDIIGTEHPYVMLQFGKYREDPDNQLGVEERTQGNVNQLSDAGRTLLVKGPRTPDNGGEYGLTVNYFADWLNNTSFAFSYLNVHSRFPFVSFQAAQLGCAHDSTTAVDATTSCEGFKTAANHDGLEVIPIDTVHPFLDYPENIHTLGASFSTNLGDVSWTGEVVYRPNQPLQVDVTDVGFAALQPIFPAASILVAPNPASANITIPARRVAVPDYLMTTYRKQDVVPGSDIPGYERFKTINYDMSILYLAGASDNPFGADQLTTLVEVGGFQILDMPELDTLQIGAPGVFYHHSAGVDSTGTPTPEQTTFPATPGDRLNPHYQEGGFATAFSWGYRVIGQLSYEDVLPGVKLNPQFQWFDDVKGKSPLPAGEFIEGRKQAMLGLQATYQANWNAALRYTWFFGAGQSNGLSDRDNLLLQLTYDF